MLLKTGESQLSELYKEGVRVEATVQFDLGHLNQVDFFSHSSVSIPLQVI